jgi:hypothetical protein
MFISKFDRSANWYTSFSALLIVYPVSQDTLPTNQANHSDFPIFLPILPSFSAVSTYLALPTNCAALPAFVALSAGNTIDITSNGFS